MLAGPMGRARLVVEVVGVAVRSGSSAKGSLASWIATLRWARPQVRPAEARKLLCDPGTRAHEGIGDHRLEASADHDYERDKPRTEHGYSARV